MEVPAVALSDDGIHDRVAVVTGAASGIGQAVAEALAERGAVVAGLDRDEEGLLKNVRRLVDAGYRASGHPVDVRDSAAVDAVVADLESSIGPVDILVNTAGVLRMAPVLELSDEDWSATFDVNTEGIFHVSRAVAKRMAARSRGSIVTVASNAGVVPRMHMAAYSASKAASRMFTQCLGLELAGQGVRCNVVSPGSTDTPMLRGMWHDDTGPQATLTGDLGNYRLGIPLGRIASPADVADAVVFLASDRARHITMHDLCVDGGATLGA